MSGIVEVDVLGIGVHRAHLLPDIFSRVREIDTVAEALRHLLLAIRTGQTTSRHVLRQHDIGFREHLCIDLVKTASELTRHLQHRLLILTDGHRGRLEQQNIRSLRHGVAEETEGHALAFEATHLDLRLHRRIALNARDTDEVHQIGSQLSQFRNLTLDKEHALLGVKACGQVVEGHLDDVLSDLLGVVSIISEGLHIGHKHEHTVIIARILQLDTTAQRANVVS